MISQISTPFLLLLLAIVPGYLTVLFWSRARTWRGFPSDLQSILQGLAASAVIQLLISPVTLWQLYPIRDHLIDHPVRVLAWGTLAVLVMPYILGTGAAKLESLGMPYLYFENLEGGHSAAADLRQGAKREALEFTYLAQRLLP